MAKKSHKRKSSSEQTELSAKRRKAGFSRRFDTPEQLWGEAKEYFEWVDDNPLIEQKYYSNAGVHELMDCPKMRAMSVAAMCLHMGVAERTWRDYCSIPEFEDVTEAIKSTIHTQKFEGGAANLLNSNIISRDLGLTEKTSNEHTGADGGPVAVFNFIPVGPDDS